MKLARGRESSPLGPPPARMGGGWGGYVILPRGERVLQVRFTGVLTHERFHDLTVSLHANRDRLAGGGYVLLDATHLLHLSAAVAILLAQMERRWREEGLVVLWVGLSPYLANLLVLSGSGSRIPLLPDLNTALTALKTVAGLPPSVARERLDAWDIMRH